MAWEYFVLSIYSRSAHFYVSSRHFCVETDCFSPSKRLFKKREDKALLVRTLRSKITSSSVLKFETLSRSRSQLCVRMLRLVQRDIKKLNNENDYLVIHCVVPWVEKRPTSVRLVIGQQTTQIVRPVNVEGQHTKSATTRDTKPNGK